MGLLTVMLMIDMAALSSPDVTAKSKTPSVTPATGNGLSLGRNTLDAGGGLLGNGANVSLRGTLGQPDAGVSTSGELELRGGFWRRTSVPAETLFNNGFE